jgi:hypothetical protein
MLQYNTTLTSLNLENNKLKMESGKVTSNDYSIDILGNSQY